jgi:hypothetical protein
MSFTHILHSVLRHSLSLSHRHHICPRCLPLCVINQSTTASRTAHRDLPIALKHEVRSRMTYPYLASSTPVYLPCSSSRFNGSVNVRVRIRKVHSELLTLSPRMCHYCHQLQCHSALSCIDKLKLSKGHRNITLRVTQISPRVYIKLNNLDENNENHICINSIFYRSCDPYIMTFEPSLPGGGKGPYTLTSYKSLQVRT